jgi:hypothetical protein
MVGYSYIICIVGSYTAIACLIIVTVHVVKVKVWLAVPVCSSLSQLFYQFVTPRCEVFWFLDFRLTR